VSAANSVPLPAGGPRIVTAGLAYSWKKWSLTFTMNNLNVLNDNDADADADEEFSEYGTLTVAWKLD